MTVLEGQWTDYHLPIKNSLPSTQTVPLNPLELSFNEVSLSFHSLFLKELWEENSIFLYGNYYKPTLSKQTIPAPYRITVAYSPLSVMILLNSNTPTHFGFDSAMQRFTIYKRKKALK